MKIWPLGGLLAALLFCCANQVLAQATLSGKITDEAGNPLAGASVELVTARLGTFTDADGHYQFEHLPTGFQVVEVRFLGFEKASNVTGHLGNGLLDFQLKPAQTTLDEVAVAATRAGAKAPFTSSTMSRQALESQHLGQDVPMLLDGQPAVVVSSDAGAGFGYTGLRIRGTDPTRINVTINGIPLNDAESQAVFWVDLPDLASSTESIQIQRGVGTSTNGAAAFGASINLNTSKLLTEPYAEFSGTAGSFGTWKGTVKFGAGSLAVCSWQSPRTLSADRQAKNQEPRTHFTLDGRASRITSDGYIDRARVDLKSFYLSSAYVGEKFALRANVFAGNEVTYQAWNGVPAQFVNDGMLRKFNVSGTEKTGEPHDNEVDDYTQTHYQLLFSKAINRNWQINLAGHWTQGRGFFEQYKAGQNLNDYGLVTCDTCPLTDLIRRRWLDNDFFGGTWALAYTTNGQQLQSTLGGAWNQYLGDHFGEITWAEQYPGLGEAPRYYNGTGDKRDFNVFSKTQYSFKPFLHGFLDLQYRRVSHAIDGTDNDLRETKTRPGYHFFNPKLGFMLDFLRSKSAYASFAVANREPNRSDFTDAAPGNAPRPERLLNSELGLKWEPGPFLFRANVYHMHYRDQLVLTGNINDVGAPIRTNVPDSYRLGLELTGSYSLHQRLLLEANLALSRNKIRDFTERIDNWDTGAQEVLHHSTTDIALSPQVVAFGKMGYRIGNDPMRVIPSLSVKHVGRQFIDNTSNGSTVLPAYSVVGAQIQVVFKPAQFLEISLNLLVNNVLDKKYSANAWAYRYISEGYDGRADNPFTRLEGGSTYNLTGYFPQAGRNFLLGVSVKI